MFVGGARAQSHENSDQTERIDRDKDGNESEQEFLDHYSDCSGGLRPSLEYLRQSQTAATEEAMKTFAFWLFRFVLPLALLVDLRAADLKTVNDFSPAAAKANAVLTIPDWEQTPEAVDAAMKDAIANANKALDQIGAQDLGKVTFKSTVVALDDLTYKASLAANKATIIKESNTNEKMRTAAENAVKVFQEWVVSIDYREDVYKTLKAFADTHPQLSGEDKKLFDETMRDYRRAGLDLPPDKRKEVEQLRKDLSKLGTDFDTNIVNSKAPVVFTKAELDGVPESFFTSPGIKAGDETKTGAGDLLMPSYVVMANVTWQFVTVQENAKSEAARKKLYVVHDSLA